MAALLIIGGMLWIFLGLLWLIVLAFGVSLLWGVGSLLPPILLLFVVRCWSVTRKAVVFMAVGCIPLVAGVAQLAILDAARVEALLNFSWLHGAQEVEHSTQIDLHGELHGQPFRPEYGELIDGVVLLREGKDFFAQRELRIVLPSHIKVAQQGLRLDVLPQDTGKLPEIEIMWLLPEQGLPEARRIARGYTLHLDLQHQAPNRLTGNFHLVLPPQFKTSMSGEIELLSNRLHYLNGMLDRRYDDVATLEYVVQDYLEWRFNQDAVVQPLATPTTFSAPLDLDVTAYLDGELQRMPIRLIKSADSGWAVLGDEHSERAAQTAPATLLALATEQVTQAVKTEGRVDRRVRFSLQRLLVNPAQYRYLKMHLQTIQGNQIKGRFMGLDAQGALTISRELKGPGTVSFSVLPAEIERITLLEP